MCKTRDEKIAFTPQVDFFISFSLDLACPNCGWAFHSYHRTLSTCSLKFCHICFIRRKRFRLNWVHSTLWIAECALSKGEKCRKHTSGESKCKFFWLKNWITHNKNPIKFQQRRFSENPSNKIWESEESRNSPLREKFELVECHAEPSSSYFPTAPKKTPKLLLTALPTLSISGPSRSGSPISSPTKEDDEERQNFL